MAALRKIYKKKESNVHPFCYLFRKQEEGRHEAVGRAVPLGTRFQTRQRSDGLLVVCRR